MFNFLIIVLIFNISKILTDTKQFCHIWVQMEMELYSQHRRMNLTPTITANTRIRRLTHTVRRERGRGELWSVWQA